MSTTKKRCHGVKVVLLLCPDGGRGAALAQSQSAVVESCSCPNRGRRQLTAVAEMVASTLMGEDARRQP